MGRLGKVGLVSGGRPCCLGSFLLDFSFCTWRLTSTSSTLNAESNITASTEGFAILNQDATSIWQTLPDIDIARRRVFESSCHSLQKSLFVIDLHLAPTLIQSINVSDENLLGCRSNADRTQALASAGFGKGLRLMIYDELPAPFTQRPKHFETYVLPSEWPKTDFTPYRALLLTCKEVKEEATTHFKGHFVRDVMIYFVDLRNFYFKLERASDPEKLAEMRVCIHTLPSAIQHHLATKPKTSVRFHHVNHYTNDFCIDKFKDNDLTPQVSHSVNLQANPCGVNAGSSQNPPLDYTHKMREGAKLDSLESEGRTISSRTTFKVISRRMCSKYSTMYTQMVAPISCLGGHEGLSASLRYCSSILGVRSNKKRGCLWPGTKEYEQELKEEYGLDA